MRFMGILLCPSLTYSLGHFVIFILNYPIMRKLFNNVMTFIGIIKKKEAPVVKNVVTKKPVVRKKK